MNDHTNEARYVREHTPPIKRGGHKLDEEAVCIHCGFDAAEHWHWRNMTYEGRYAALDGKADEPLCTRAEQKPLGAIDSHS